MSLRDVLFRSLSRLLNKITKLSSRKGDNAKFKGEVQGWMEFRRPSHIRAKKCTAKGWEKKGQENAVVLWLVQPKGYRFVSTTREPISSTIFFAGTGIIHTPRGLRRPVLGPCATTQRQRRCHALQFVRSRPEGGK